MITLNIPTEESNVRTLGASLSTDSYSSDVYRYIPWKRYFKSSKHESDVKETSRSAQQHIQAAVKDSHKANQFYYKSFILAEQKIISINQIVPFEAAFCSVCGPISKYYFRKENIIK